MYPRYPDVIRTIQQNLTLEIIPDLSTEYAREQAWGVLVLLEHLLNSWDRAADMLREENRDLRETIREIGGGAQSPVGAGTDPDAAGRGQALMTENRELRERLATAIATAPKGSGELRLAREFMARQLQRETAAVTGVAPAWD